MNLIAKMGIKPPPGFITEIPPMADSNGENANPEVHLTLSKFREPGGICVQFHIAICDACMLIASAA